MSCKNPFFKCDRWIFIVTDSQYKFFINEINEETFLFFQNIYFIFFRHN